MEASALAAPRTREPRPALRVAVAAAAILPAIVFMGLSWPYDVDDAYILVRYGVNLAEGHGLAWNPGAAPVEGYTNLVYVLVAALLHLVGVEAQPVFKAAGAVFGQLCLLLTFLLGRALGLSARASALASILLGLSSGFAFWSVAGLETPFFTALLLAALLLFVRGGRDPLVAALFFVAALTRTEAPALLAPLVALRLYEHRGRGPLGAAKATLPLLLPFALPFAAFFAWRVSYFGVLFPNPIYFKAGGGLGATGRSVLVPFAATWAPVLALAAAGAAALRGRVLLPAALAAASLAIYATAKGDVAGATSTMAFYDRFLLPVLPCFLLLAAAAVDRGLGSTRRLVRAGAAAALLAAIGWELGNPLTNPRIVGTMAISQEEGVAPSVEALARYLSSRFGASGVVAIGDVGLVGVRYRGPVQDLYGLNDYAYTLRHRGDARAFLSEVIASEPDAIVLCAIDGPSGVEVAHEAEQLVLDDPRFRAGWSRTETFRSGINPWAYVVFERYRAR